MIADFLFRLIVLGLSSYGGWRLAEYLGGFAQTQSLVAEYELPFKGVVALISGVLGLSLIPYFLGLFIRWFIRQIRQISARAIFAGTVGLVISLILSALLALPLSMLPGQLGQILPVVVSASLIIFWVSLLIMREQDLVRVLHSYFPGLGSNNHAPAVFGGDQILLDTSAIIDGRIADITQTGFVSGTLLIPRFVLNELRHIADSADPLRRNRGRRGFDMLNKLQKGSDVPIQITEADVEEARDVDVKLVRLAKSLRCPIMTNDFNLNRSAELQGVRVLNINELANAVKSVVLPGEELTLKIIQEGREFGQGVGFLDDGTMVVVEGGRRYIGNDLEVVVSRVLQTAAGRMIFAQPKEGVGPEELRSSRGRASA